MVLTKIIGSFLSGFILSNATLNGGQSPLVVGLIGALSLSESIFAFLGAILAYLVTGRITEALTELCSMVLILVVKVIFSEFIRKELKSAGLAFLTATAYIFCGLAVSFAMTLPTVAFLLVLCKGVLCGCGAFFLIMTMSAARQERRLVISGTAGAALGVVFMLAIASLSAASFSFFNLGRTLGILVVLLAARKFKYAGGAVCGALVTCGTVLYSPEMGRATMLLAVAGLAAGIFAEFGTLPTAFFFISANALGLIAIGVTPETARILVDVLFATLAFVLVPERLTAQILGVNAISRDKSRINALTASKLDFAAKTIREVRKSVEQISSALEKKNVENDVAVSVCDRICGKCRNNLYCWENEFDRSFQHFTAIKQTLERKGKVQTEELPAGLSKCFKRSELVDCFNESYQQELVEKRAGRRLNEMRGILYEQFSGMEDMLQQISREIVEASEYDDELSKAVKSFLLDFGAQQPRVCVFFSSFGKIRIEAFYEGQLTLSEVELAVEVSEIVDRDLELPQIFTANGYSKLCLIEKTAFMLEFATSQKTGRGEEVCGDKYEIFQDGLGNAYLILSDGMGSGKMAALDSMMASSLLVRLLKAGVGFSAAVRIINSSMLVKSSDESFATLDVACVNLYTGRLDILKMGASATFVRTGKRVSCVEASSLPVGILRDLEPDKRSTILKEGDAVVMLSDGIEEKNYTFIREMLLKENPASPKELTREILEKSYESIEPAKADDITVLMAMVKANNE